MLALSSLLGWLVFAAPARATVAGGQAFPPVRHVVEIMLENHTFDSLFGHFPGALGIPASTTLPSPAPGGAPVRPLLALPDAGDVQGGLNNSRAAELTMMDLRSGHYAMDGYTRYPGEGLSAITGFAASVDPNLQYLARTYALADRNFQPAIAPTLPNVLLALAGTAHGLTTNSEPPPSLSWWTIFDQLEQAGYSAAFYSGVPASVYAGTVWPRLIGAGHTVEPVSAFLAAARRGTLPAFSFVRPGVGYSEEPPEDVGEGDAWLGELLAAIGASPQWSSTAVFVTYDEGGGFWDGVAPAPRSGEGTRTPTVIVSPYVRPGVFSQTSTNLSILAFTEHLFGLPPLDALVARQNDFASAFEATPAAPRPHPPVDPPATIAFLAPGLLSDPAPLRPGTAEPVTLLEEGPGLTPNGGNATVTLSYRGPAGADVSSLPAHVRLVDGRASLEFSFPTAGYYRVRASAAGGVLGYLTFDVGVGADTIP